MSSSGKSTLSKKQRQQRLEAAPELWQGHPRQIPARNDCWFDLPVTRMAQEIDWLNSQAGLCKVDLYKHDILPDQNCEVVCFVDVSTLNLKEKERDQKAKKVTSQSSIVSVSSNDLDLALENLEEKEVIVIKDNERSNAINTVCLFKQGTSEEANVVNWLSNDLQKYAAGFQQALSHFTVPQTPRPFHPPVLEKMGLNNGPFLRRDGTLLQLPEFRQSTLSPSKP